MKIYSAFQECPLAAIMLYKKAELKDPLLFSNAKETEEEVDYGKLYALFQKSGLIPPTTTRHILNPMKLSS